jgi:outer membrane lipoprotein-sorting protein
VSVENRLVKTPGGQRLDQTDIGHFIDFLFRSIKGVRQKDSEFHEDGQRISFFLWAQDYVGGEKVEKYRVIISKEDWLPVLIARHDEDGTPIEIAHIKNYSINNHLEDGLFRP